MSTVKILVRETYDTYGYDSGLLVPSSDEPVIVKCNTCHEVFTRHRRHASLPHDCLAHKEATAPYFTPYKDQGRQPDQPVRIECKLVHPLARLPYRKRGSDAGLDLFSIEDNELLPHTAVNVNTGIILVAPDSYYFAVEGRSSLWTKGVMPMHSIIDGCYSGPLIIAMTNISDEPYMIKGPHGDHPGDRFAQVVLHRIVPCDISKVDAISPSYSHRRGEAGFGSSGR